MERRADEQQAATDRVELVLGAGVVPNVVAPLEPAIAVTYVAFEYEALLETQVTPSASTTII